MQIKLLIAEDELATREGLLQCIPRTELGLSQIYAAGNGLAAYDLALETSPDIVLCDIRMPKLSGIELARRLRECFESIQIIFISGYADKEYLKAAISLQASGYIEKPIDEEELLALLRDTIGKIRLRRKSESDVKRLTEHDKAFMRQQLLYAALRDPAQLDDILYSGDATARTVLASPECLCASIHLHWADTWSAQAIDVSEKQIAQELEACMPGETLCGMLTGTQMGMLAYTVPLTASAAFCASLGEALRRLKRSYPALVCAHACVSESGARLYALSGLYGRVNAEAKWAAFASREAVSCVLLSSSSAQDAPDCRAEFAQALQTHDFALAKQLVQGQTDALCQAQRGSIDVVRKNYEALLGICMDFGAATAAADALTALRFDAFSSFARLNTLEELSRFLLVRIDELLPRLPMPEGLSLKIEQALLYIERNLSDPALSIQAIAESLHISENYLSNLYKRETGQTLHKTITFMRIERAKFLLRRGVRPSGIAERIGFSNTSYFSAVFKKTVGRSPADYQRAILKEARQ